MQKVTQILNNLNNGIPQGLARFNDGEVGIMFDKDFVAARGDQKGSIELQVALLDAVRHEQENYWKGYPCGVCMKKQRNQVLDANLFNPSYKYNTTAVVNTNRNWEVFKEGIIQGVKGKRVIWVSGEDQDVSKLDMKIENHIRHSLKNAWANYGSIISECIQIVRPHDVFLISSGPMARVMVKNLFEMRPDATFLDIGSTFDPYTRNVWHKCHKGTLKECEGCN